MSAKRNRMDSPADGGPEKTSSTAHPDVTEHAPSKRHRQDKEISLNGHDSLEEESQQGGSDVDEELDDIEGFNGSQHSAVDRLEQRLSQASNTCAEAGVIESVTLVDFMCHENLSIDLGPNMNFIIGHNGSGKSAILTAITGKCTQY